MLQLLILLVGTSGYYLLTGDEYSLLDALYMTVITITTVGYDESIPIDHDPVLMVFTIFLVIIGMGAVLYFVTVMATFVIEGEFRHLFARRRMQHEIDRLKNHFIIAGLGRTGKNLAEDIVLRGESCVLIDKEQQRVETLVESLDREIAYLIGDGTDDEILHQAGIERAKGIAFCLGEDKENLFGTISAHRLNPTIRIVTRGDDPRSEEKFRMAGADQVVFINSLGGKHMAAELVDPRVSDFMSLLFSHPERDHDVDRILIGEKSPWIGRSLGEIDIRRYTRALVIAFVDEGGESFFSPGPEERLREKTELVVLAPKEDFPKIETFLATGKWPGEA